VMFGVQTINFVTQRGAVYFVHPAPPVAAQLGTICRGRQFCQTTNV
jgi:hypothetical protein